MDKLVETIQKVIESGGTRNILTPPAQRFGRRVLPALVQEARARREEKEDGRQGQVEGKKGKEKEVERGVNSGMKIYSYLISQKNTYYVIHNRTQSKTAKGMSQSENCAIHSTRNRWLLL